MDDDDDDDDDDDGGHTLNLYYYLKVVISTGKFLESSQNSVSKKFSIVRSAVW